MMNYHTKTLLQPLESQESLKCPIKKKKGPLHVCVIFQIITGCRAALIRGVSPALKLVLPPPTLFRSAAAH